MSEWKKYKLGNVGKIITGKTPPTNDSKNFGNEYPFITPRDMNTQKIIHKTERYLSEKGKLLLKNNLLPESSICISCIGSDLGKVVMTSEISFTNQQLNSIICSRDFDPDFIYYSILLISEKLRNIGKSSTAVPIVNKSQFSDFEIQAPKGTAKQRQIAAILSSLDDKIELNLQMNQTLEAIAQAIFKEWFVDFNFPGFDGELLGGLPKGWRKEKFENQFDVVRGLSYKGSGLAAKEDGIPMYNLNSVHEGGGFKYEGIKFYNGEYKEKHLARPRDIIVANTEQGHKYLLIGFPAVVPYYFGDTAIFSHHIYRVRPKEDSDLTPQFIYYLILQQEVREQIIGCSNGTTVNMLKIDGLQMPEFKLPPPDLIQKFSEIIETIWQRQENNITENESLTQLRDTLLPKLMSGQIPIQA